MPHVLLVDYDLDLCESLAEVLEREGVRSAYVTSAQAALLRLVAEPRIQIVVTDLVMPELGGFEFLRKLLVMRNRQPLATIVMTGSPSLESAVTALRLSAVEFLLKPVEAHEVARAIRGAAAHLAKGAAHGGAKQAPTNYSGMLAELRRLQQERASTFPSSVMNETCWNMLLFLAVAEFEGRVVTAMEVYAASEASPPTSFRKLNDLDKAGLITRTVDAKDGRRVIVQLTRMGSRQIRTLVTGLPGHGGQAPEGNGAGERSEVA